ncbi:hypothetical protein AGMMS50233_09800 [Endomicrobiia bacterium]|nr:hypothetical protein AGMMS50233_09800 [Endomicrobiia bacterium]
MFETIFRDGLRVADEVLITPTGPSNDPCIICTEETLRNPRQCPICGNQSCRYCVAEWFKKSNACPHCRGRLELP